MSLLRVMVLLIPYVLCAAGASAQTTWYVDADCASPGSGTQADPFCSIQQGVDSAADGDIVLVMPGTYTGDGNRDISLFGKEITLRSAEGPGATILDIQGSPTSIHRGFFLIHGETQNTIIDGFTITHGYLMGDTGGSGLDGGGGGAAIYIRDSSPSIRNCIMRENTSVSIHVFGIWDSRGGAVYVDGNSKTTITHCVIADNHAGLHGGGVMYIGNGDSELTISDSLIMNNSAAYGGGLKIWGGGGWSLGGPWALINCAVVLNHSVTTGGGLHAEVSDGRMMSNCIFWGNTTGSVGPQVYLQSGHLTIEFSDIQGGEQTIDGSGQLTWGPGNIDSDPLFIDLPNGNARLSAASPCIDAGDNLAVPFGTVTDLDGFARFTDSPAAPDTGNPGLGLGLVDMGPYEFGGDDCNNNGIPDAEDVAGGISADCDGNNVPDVCQPDCNANEVADTCDLTAGTSEDCDGNSNPDECDVDCNDNAYPDACDVAEGTSSDCNNNGVPDECEPDCNANDQADACDIAQGISPDCDDNGVPDECQPYALPHILQQPSDQAVEPGGFAYFEVVAEGLMLEYQWRKDGEDLIDGERIIGSSSPGLFILNVQPSDAGEYDCVVWHLPVDMPWCTATSEAATLTVLTCPADLSGDGTVGALDLAELLGSWGACPGPCTPGQPSASCPADLNRDCAVAPFDLAVLLGNWGPCFP